MTIVARTGFTYTLNPVDAEQLGWAEETLEAAGLEYTTADVIELARVRQEGDRLDYLCERFGHELCLALNSVNLDVNVGGTYE